jgi:hypothetical protein
MVGLFCNSRNRETHNHSIVTEVCLLDKISNASIWTNKQYYANVYINLSKTKMSVDHNQLPTTIASFQIAQNPAAFDEILASSGHELDELPIPSVDTPNAEAPAQLARAGKLRSTVQPLGDLVVGHGSRDGGSASPEDVFEEGDNVDREKIRLQRELDIANDPLLQEVAAENREATKQHVQELYDVSVEYVAPVIAGFAEHLLKSAGDDQIILAGRDGIGTYIAAQKLQEKFPDPNQKKDQVLYAYLTRNVVFDTQPDVLKKYLEQEGLRDANAPVIVGDIGMYGSMMRSLQNILPQVRLEYLISESLRIPGYASNRGKPMDSMSYIPGNPAVHFMEDTFSGAIATPDGLIEQEDGSIVPDIPANDFSPEEQLKRKYALQAIEDYVTTLRGRPNAAESAGDIGKLDAFLSHTDGYRKLMVPHHSA